MNRIIKKFNKALASNVVSNYESSIMNNCHSEKQLLNFNTGDSISVEYSIKEGANTRTQKLDGLCIAKRNRGKDGYLSSFIIRCMRKTVSFERMFFLSSPNLVSIKLLRSGRVRRAKIYYIKQLSGKKARIASARS